MMDWTLISGGRCAAQPWRIGIAGFDLEHQQAFLLAEADWTELQRQLPLGPLSIYGKSNGLIFEHVVDAHPSNYDGLLLITCEHQEQLLLQPAAQLRRYLLLREVGQRDVLADEASFIKLFTPGKGDAFDDRLVCLDHLKPALAGAGTQEWAIDREPGDQDYSRLYHCSADFWLHRVTAAIAADVATVRHTEPLLSVVIPTYNHGRYLKQCVQSVLDQGVNDLEILVLDNASTDETSQVMDEFATNPRVRYIRNRYNYGPGYNWRNGLRIAQGRYFTFLSADDYFNPGHLSRLLPVLEQNPHIAVGYTGISWVDGQGHALNQPRHPGYRSADYVGGRNEVADLLIHDLYMTPSAVIYRREAFCKVWNPGKTYGAGDWEMVVQMAEQYPDFVYADVPGVSYRWHGAQESSAFYASNQPLDGHLAIVEGVFERAAQHHLKGFEREVSAHIKRRLSLYPQERDTELGDRARRLCERLEAQARQGEEAQFSIIVTTYNRPELLRDTLSSIGRQTFRSFEVILVNDNGVPVESLVAEYDFPITYLRQGRNRGPAAARNAALRVARGQYVAFLDDDDIFLPDHLQQLAQALESHPDSVVYTDAVFILENIDSGTRVEEGRERRYLHNDYSRARLLVNNYIPINTFACLRSTALVAGDFDESLAGLEDWDFLMRLCARSDFHHIRSETVEVRMRRDTVDQGRRSQYALKDYPAIYRELYARHSDLGDEAIRRGRLEVLRSLEGSDKSTLQAWLEKRELTAHQRQLVAERLQAHEGGPSIGVVVLDLTGDEAAVKRTLDSLEPARNGYSNLRSLLISTGEQGHDRWPGATVSVSATAWVTPLNQALQDADFDWLVLLSAGDELTANGLLVACLELLTVPDCRAVYCDQMYRQPDGSLGAAFRPAFNLDYLLSFPAGMAHHWLFRRDVLVQAGGFDAELPQAVELDMILRLINSGGLAGLGHIAEPLLVTDTPAVFDQEDERLAIMRHLQGRGYEQPRVDSGQPGQYRIRYGHPQQPMVSVLLLAGSQLARLQRCVESLLEGTRYPSYELLLIANDPAAGDVNDWLKAMDGLGEARLRAVWPGQEKPSAATAFNLAASQARGEYLLMLSAETAVIDEQWLDELVNHAQRPEVGVVGGKLLAADGSVLHAGLILGLGGPVGRPFVGEALDAPGYMQRLQVDQDFSAVSRECLMIGRELYEALGGFGEDIPDCYLDVDLCLRARQAGYLSVWAANAKLMLDAASAPAVSRADQDILYSRWLPVLARDPAYNPNFSMVQPGGFKLADTALSWRPLSSWKPLPTVLAHPADQFGCGHYRVMQPFTAMQSNGLADGILSMGLMHVGDLERYDPDTIVLQRQIGDDRLEAMRRMKAFSKAFKVYELDDYLPNLPMKSAHREAMPKDILRSLKRGLSFVDRFVVSTQPLAEAFAGLHDDIQVVENRLPPGWWGSLTAARINGERPRVGWAGGASHTGDLEMIADVVRELANEVDWIFLGMCPDKLRPYVKEIHEGVHIDLYPARLASLALDLAIAPVEQNLFNECKSNLRLLEYGACGFPVVCSDLRCYQGGLPVTRVKNRFRDWVDAIRMHLSDREASIAMGDELRRVVLKDWMLEGEHLQNWKNCWLGN